MVERIVDDARGTIATSGLAPFAGYATVAHSQVEGRGNINVAQYRFADSMAAYAKLRETVLKSRDGQAGADN